MADLSIQSSDMGTWWFDLDENSQVQELRVSVNTAVEVDGSKGVFVTRGGQAINFWSTLTQGQRQQLQLIVDKVIEEIVGI